MKVFISWSGPQSKHIASGLNELLPQVIQAVEPFMSNVNIAAGERWVARLNQELESTAFGIICLTPENTVAPWLLYEAGALSKSLTDSKVCPVLYDLTFDEVEWPLAQFQLKTSNRAGLEEVVNSINLALGDKQLDTTTLGKTFDRIWPEFQEMIANVPKMSDASSPTERSDREVLNEILSLVRNRAPHLHDRPPGTTPTGHASVYVDNCLRLLSGIKRDIINEDNAHWEANGRYLIEQLVQGLADLRQHLLLHSNNPYPSARLIDRIFSELEKINELDVSQLRAYFDSLQEHISQIKY